MLEIVHTVKYSIKFPHFFWGGGEAIEPTLSFKLLLYSPFIICLLLAVRFLISGSHFMYLRFSTLQSSFYGQLIPPSSQNKSPSHISLPPPPNMDERIYCTCSCKLHTCNIVSKLKVSPFHKVNSPLDAPVTRRRPSGVHCNTGHTHDINQRRALTTTSMFNTFTSVLLPTITTYDETWFFSHS